MSDKDVIMIAISLGVVVAAFFIVVAYWLFSSVRGFQQGGLVPVNKKRKRRTNYGRIGHYRRIGERVGQDEKGNPIVGVTWVSGADPEKERPVKKRKKEVNIVLVEEPFLGKNNDPS